MNLTGKIITFFLASFLIFLTPTPVFARGGCFTADVKILTPQGEKDISTLKNGDQIISLNLEKNQKEVSSIEQVEVFSEPEYFILNSKTKVTPTHPYYVVRELQKVIVEVKDLKVGDILLNDNLEQVQVVSLERVSKQATVYNLFGVYPNNSYFANGILVHNKGGGGCFLPKTKISTPDGLKDIEQLKSGDRIYSFDESKKSKIVSTIGRIDTYEVSDYLLINDVIKVTSHHPFYIVKDGQLQIVEAGNLNLGDKFLNELSIQVPITSIQKIDQKTLVYNLVDINPNNNYFADGVLVHNKGGGGSGGSYRGGSGSSSSPSCNTIIDPVKRQECLDKDRWYGLGSFFGYIVLIFSSWLTSLLKNGSRVFIVRNVRKGSNFTSDESSISFAKSIVPGFTNVYSQSYSKDDEEWMMVREGKAIPHSDYNKFISPEELIKKATELFCKYQKDWTKKEFEKMRGYVLEPYFTTQQKIFINSFDKGFDIVYKPEVISVTPIKTKKLGNGIEIKLQINAKMVNFEILSGDHSVGSGEPNFREFTEYWFVIVEDGKVSLERISQLSQQNKTGFLNYIIILVGLILIVAVPIMRNEMVRSLNTNPIATSSAIPNSQIFPTPVVTGDGVLKVVNEYRLSKGVPALVYSTNLCSYARKRVDSLLYDLLYSRTTTNLQQQNSLDELIKNYPGTSVYELSVTNAVQNNDFASILRSKTDTNNVLLMVEDNRATYTKACVETKIEGYKSATVLLMGDY